MTIINGIEIDVADVPIDEIKQAIIKITRYCRYIKSVPICPTIYSGL
jgi:hypothetical protein